VSYEPVLLGSVRTLDPMPPWKAVSPRQIRRKWRLLGATRTVAPAASMGGVCIHITTGAFALIHLIQPAPSTHPQKELCVPIFSAAESHGHGPPQ
jgi:hypothetical protein